MADKLRIGIIGTGTMAQRHIKAYKANPNAQLWAICDANAARAEAVAKEAGVDNWYSDYRDLLANPEVDAVSIITPTFTHKAITIDALKAGKHVLCEKPPALNVAEVEECMQAAKESGKLLMYGFVQRFSQNIRFLKDYIATGAMGDIYAVDVARMQRCSMLAGWFLDKEKSGGGQLMDAAIHQIDSALYLMGFPAIKSVRGYAGYANPDLPGKIKGLGGGYRSADNVAVERTVESMASAYVTFENNAYLYVKASHIMHTVEEGSSLSICGTKAGARINKDGVKIVRVDNSGYFLESTPVLTEKRESFMDEIDHFVDCCVNGTECIASAESGLPVMQLISAIYESAQSGEEVRFS